MGIGRMRQEQPCLGCEAEVRSIFQALLQRDVTDYDAMMNMGNVESSVGNELAARQWYERVISIAPRHAGAHFKLATSLHKSQAATTLAEVEQIAELYRPAIRLEPAIEDGHNNLALLFAMTGQGRRAREVWAQGIAIHPGN